MSTPHPPAPVPGAGSAVPSEESPERGSGSMVAVLIGMVLIALLAAGLTAGQTWRAASQARTAADLSALAASGATAPTALLPVPPCVTAGLVARENGATLVSCTVRDFDVTVRVAVDSHTPFGPAIGQSTAGPRPQDGPRKKPRGTRPPPPPRGELPPPPPGR